MKHTILFLFIGLCIASCHETDYPTFDDSVIDIYFTQDSVNYSFGVTPLSTTEHVVELPVNAPMPNRLCIIRCRNNSPWRKIPLMP